MRKPYDFLKSQDFTSHFSNFDLTMNPWVVISLFGVGQGLFLSFGLFFLKRGKRLANRILAALIFLFSLRLAEFVGYWTNFFRDFPHFAFTTVSFQFLFGVLLYFYARAVTAEKFPFKKYDLLHFLPFAIQFISLLPFYLESQEYKITVLKNTIFTDNPILSTRFFITESLQNLQMLVYTALILRLIKTYHQKTNGAFLSIERLNLKWLRNLTIGFGFFIALDFVQLLEMWLWGYEYIFTIDTVVIVASAILIYAIGYMALRQPEVISGTLALKNAPKYERSSLTAARAEAYLKKLFIAMEDDKLFAHRDLNLETLARKLAVSQHHLSQIINEKLHQNFSDFVNGRRIAEAKKILSDPERDHYTILSIAIEVGFNNKASFNAAFKKHAGMTPSQFRNAAKQPS